MGQENCERKQCDAFHAFGPGLRGCLDSLLALFREGGRAPGLPHAWGGALRRGARSRVFSWRICRQFAGAFLAVRVLVRPRPSQPCWSDIAQISSFMFSRLYKMACHPTISRVELADTFHFPFDQLCA